MGKMVIKSVRFSDDLLIYIDGYRGDTFTDKLSNIIYDCMLAEPERVKRLADLDIQIQQRCDELRELVKNCDVISSIRRDSIYVSKDLARILSRLDHVVLQISPTVPDAAGETVIQRD